MLTTDYYWLEQTYPRFVRHQTKSGWRYFKSVSGYQSDTLSLPPAPSGVLMIDFTRRSGPETIGSDPANPSYANILRWHAYFDWKDRYEDVVLVFWTKSPNRVMQIYRPMIEHLQRKGVTFLMFVTRNGYYYPIEPNVTPEDQDISEAVKVLGSNAIRYRFDPIILGYDSNGDAIPISQHWDACVSDAIKYGISNIVINFLVPHYKGAGKKLEKMDYSILDPSFEQKQDVLGRMLDVLPDSISIQGCAESFMFKDIFPGKIKPSACTDPNWALDVNPNLAQRGIFHGNASRKGKDVSCGCVYWSDLGIYHNMGADKCERGCVVCYAQNNLPII